MSDEGLYARAFTFARAAHTGQTRKYTGEPYFHHCLAVSQLVSIRTDDPELVAAALLHDTLEDTDTDYGGLCAEFGPRVADTVQELTDEFTNKAYPAWNRAKRKRAEAERLGRVSGGAQLIKLCDLIDNTKSIVEHDPDFAVTYLREKADILEAMGYGK